MTVVILDSGQMAERERESIQPVESGDGGEGLWSNGVVVKWGSGQTGYWSKRVVVKRKMVKRAMRRPVYDKRYIRTVVKQDNGQSGPCPAKMVVKRDSGRLGWWSNEIVVK